MPPFAVHLFRCSAAIAVFVTHFTASYAQVRSGPFRPDLIGNTTLPTLEGDHLPAACLDFSEACAAEADGNYEKAIQLYEERYSVCGDYGWNITGHGQGSNDFVVFKRTPCGLHVAIKPSRKPKECMMLKLLTEGKAYDDCPGCFPRYFYRSNFTQSCYSEYVNASHIKGLPVRYVRIHRVKALFLQGLHIIRVLRSHNIEHRDLGYRNILCKETKQADGRVTEQLIFFDFGSYRTLDSLAYLDDIVPGNRSSRHHHHHHHGVLQDTRPETGPTPRRLDGNGRHTDIYSLACAFYGATYHDGSCHGNPPPLPKDATLWSYALIRIMMIADSHVSEPDYAAIVSLVHGAQKAADDPPHIHGRLRNRPSGC
jgi:hypothetical protein